MPRTIDLTTKPALSRFARATVRKKIAPKIEPDGGMYGAGVIRNVSVVSQGEAVGHDLFADATLLRQVHSAIEQAGETGIKSRFTHPGMSSDGLGRHLGRITNSRLSGTSVVADLHFTKSSHETPDGDLANYVSLLVSEDSTAAGLSVVFARDYEAESKFLVEHGASIHETSDGCVCVDLSGFKSPDKKNTENLPHARLASLRAVDVVDEPAANPDGMFESVSVAREVDAALSYALGLQREKPQVEELLGVNIDRASEFLSRFFSTKGLSIVEAKETTLSATDEASVSEIDNVSQIQDGEGKDATPHNQDEQAEPVVPSAPSVTRELLTAELSKFTARFGSDDGVKWFTSGKSWTEALELHCCSLAAQVSELQSTVNGLNERLQSLSIGESESLNVANLKREPVKASSISEAKALAASTR